MLSAEGQSVPLKVTDQGDRTYRVEFEPSTVGAYQTSVMFAGQLTPSSPYTVNVQPAAVDTSKVRVTDMPQGGQPPLYFYFLRATAAPAGTAESAH